MADLHQFIEERGISVRELSRLTNVHPNTLNKYLSADSNSCTNGRLRVFWKIANGLEVDVETLLCGDNWHPTEDIIRSPISIHDAISRKAVWLNTSTMDIRNQIRSLLHLDNYSTLSAYENYRWVPTIADALSISQYLNCTIDALWGKYFKELENAG